MATAALWNLAVYAKIPYIYSVGIDMATATRKKRDSNRELKRERIEVRVTASAKDVIARAMTVSGLTAGDLAYEGARRLLDEHERTVLTGADRDAFVDALLNPAKPTEALVAAMHRHRKMFG